MNGINELFTGDEYFEMFPFNLMSKVLYVDAEQSMLGLWNRNVSEFLKAMDDRLTPREIKILILRYKDKLTLDEIGEQFGVSRERIRQIISKAERKLRVLAAKNNSFICPGISDYQNLIKENELLYSAIKQCADLTSSQKDYFCYDDVDIEKMDLSVRTYNCIKRFGMDTLQDIIDYDNNQILSAKKNEEGNYCELFSRTWGLVRNLGRKSLTELATKVYAMCGYRLKIPERTDLRTGVTLYSLIPIEEDREENTPINED